MRSARSLALGLVMALACSCSSHATGPDQTVKSFCTLLALPHTTPAQVAALQASASARFDKLGTVPNRAANGPIMKAVIEIVDGLTVPSDVPTPLAQLFNGPQTQNLSPAHGISDLQAACT